MSKGVSVNSVSPTIIKYVIKIIKKEEEELLKLEALFSRELYNSFLDENSAIWLMWRL